ncbi:MAG: murein transglycosylase A [Phaeodactylibacter sp.]|nr:murein transglycosylase A [Phaeodactylibacter sp.]MCB9274320.1 murein transglycosylase A [Lewinellaceae bacterium]
MNKYKALVISLFITCFGCERPKQGDKGLPHPGEPVLSFPGSEDGDEAINYIFARDGRRIGGPRMQDVYEPSRLDTIDLPFIDGAFIEALEYNRQLLELQARPKNRQIGSLRVTAESLDETIRLLKAWQQTKPMGISDYLEAYQIWGGDRRGNVRFTGYFTPVVKVSKKPQGKYIYPLYSRPLEWEGELPGRAQIEGEGALDGLGLELAYAADKVDVYYMQVQGSGFVEYTDGTRELFAYNGTNRQPYRSIEKFILSREDIAPNNLSIRGIRKYLEDNIHLADTVLFYNPSYTFFTRKRSVPKGAGNVPLSEDFSIAVDQRYIPLGSCLLAAFPIFDHRSQKVVSYEYRYFVAQDVGGAIKGPGHIDVYFGIGSQASREAGRVNNYGRLWILLPKQPRAHFISIE